jgi:hypothetical protein
MMQNGKGDSRRPMQIDPRQMAFNWSVTFATTTGGHTPNDSSGSQHAQHADADSSQGQRNNTHDK